MGKLYAELGERLIEFIAEQPIFFVPRCPAHPRGGCCPRSP